MRKIGLSEIEDIALGASLLGAGGGGDPYVGKLVAIGAVREAFLLHREYLADARKLFPHKNAYHTREMEFARACRLRIAGGETGLYECQRPLEPIAREKDEASLDTLEVYLLDAQCSYQRAGELLFLHKNTVKYRLNRCSDLVGYHIGDFPDTLPLYHAVAVRRLLRS